MNVSAFFIGTIACCPDDKERFLLYAAPVSSVRNATAPYTLLSEYSGIHIFVIFSFFEIPDIFRP